MRRVPGLTGQVPTAAHFAANGHQSPVTNGSPHSYPPSNLNPAITPYPPYQPGMADPRFASHPPNITNPSTPGQRGNQQNQPLTKYEKRFEEIKEHNRDTYVNRFAIIGSMIGIVAGAVIGSFGFGVGGFVGAIAGGVVGLFIGKGLGRLYAAWQANKEVANEIERILDHEKLHPTLLEEEREKLAKQLKDLKSIRLTTMFGLVGSILGAVTGGLLMGLGVSILPGGILLLPLAPEFSGLVGAGIGTILGGFFSSALRRFYGAEQAHKKLKQQANTPTISP